MPCNLPLVEDAAMSRIAGQMAVAYASGTLETRTAVAIKKLFPSAQYFSMSVLAGGKSGVLISADMLAASAVKISFLPVKQSLAGQACTSGERYQQLHWTSEGPRFEDLEAAHSSHGCSSLVALAIPEATRTGSGSLATTASGGLLSGPGAVQAAAPAIGALSLGVAGAQQLDDTDVMLLLALADALSPYVVRYVHHMVKDLESVFMQPRVAQCLCGCRCGLCEDADSEQTPSEVTRHATDDAAVTWWDWADPEEQVDASTELFDCDIFSHQAAHNLKPLVDDDHGSFRDAGSASSRSAAAGDSSAREHAPLTRELMEEHDFAELGQQVLFHSRPSRHHPHAGSRQHRKSFQPSAVGSLDTSLTLSGLVPGLDWHSASHGRRRSCQRDSLDSALPRLQPGQPKLLRMHTGTGTERSLRARRSEDSGKPTSCSTINSAAVEQLLRRSLDTGCPAPVLRAGPGPRPSASVSPVPELGRGVSLSSLAQANVLVDELVRAQDTPSAEEKVLAAGLAQDRPQVQRPDQEQGPTGSADDRWLSRATSCWPEHSHGPHQSQPDPSAAECASHAATAGSGPAPAGELGSLAMRSRPAACAADWVSHAATAGSTPAPGGKQGAMPCMHSCADSTAPPSSGAVSVRKRASTSSDEPGAQASATAGEGADDCVWSPSTDTQQGPLLRFLDAALEQSFQQQKAQHPSKSAVMFSVVHAIVLVLMMCAEPRGVSSFKLWGHSLAVLAPSLLGLVMGARHLMTAGPVLCLLACCVFREMALAGMSLLNSAPALGHIRWMLSALAGNMIMVRCLGKKVDFGLYCQMQGVLLAVIVFKVLTALPNVWICHVVLAAAMLTAGSLLPGALLYHTERLQRLTFLSEHVTSASATG